MTDTIMLNHPQYLTPEEAKACGCRQANDEDGGDWRITDDPMCKFHYPAVWGFAKKAVMK